MTLTNRQPGGPLTADELVRYICSLSQKVDKASILKLSDVDGGFGAGAVLSRFAESALP